MNDGNASTLIAQRLEHLVGEVSLLAPPAPVHQAIVALFASAESRVGGMVSNLRRRIVAAVQHDGVGGLAFGGARGVVADRHVLFASEIADVSAQIRRIGDGFRIDGLLVPAGDEDVVRSIRVEQPSVQHVVSTDEFGHFDVITQSGEPMCIVVEFDPETELVLGPIDLTGSADA